MVRLSYQSIDDSFHEIRAKACGRTACTVMLMVANDIDAMASARMLTQLLRSEAVPFTLRPVFNATQIQQCFRSSFTTDIKSVILINCGAIYNIPKLFGLEQGGDFRVYILDHHRPIHLANLYSRYNVVIFDDQSEIDADSYAQAEGLAAAIPSDGSDLSSGHEMSSGNEDDDEEEEDGDGDDDLDDVDIEDEDEDERRPNYGEDAEVDFGEAEAEAEDENEQADDEAEAEAEEEEDEDEDDREEVGDGDEEAPRGSLTDEPAAEGDEDEVDAEGSRAVSASTKGLSALGKRKSRINEGEGEDEGEDGSGAEVEEEPEGEDPIGTDDSEADEPAGDGLKAKKKSKKAENQAEEDEEQQQQLEEDQAEAEQVEQIHDEDEDEEEVVIGKRRKALEAKYDPVKIRRRKLQVYYSQSIRFAAPTSLMMLFLVGGRYGSHLPLDLLWQAILGVTDLYHRSLITEDSYLEYIQHLSMQLSDHLVSGPERGRYSVSDGQSDVSVPGSQEGHIKEGLEYRFFLYRHWSLYDAMFYSPYIGAKLLVWQSQGASRLQELLAKMGMKLQECKQSFNHIRPELINHFRLVISGNESKAEYNLVNPDVHFRSFSRSTSFNNSIAATDIVFASWALLEMCYDDPKLDTVYSAPDIESDPSSSFSTPTTAPSPSSLASSNSSKSRLDAFYEAYDSLGSKADRLTEKGIQCAIELQKIIVRKAAVLLEGDDSIVRLSCMYYCNLRSPGAIFGLTSSSSSSFSALASSDTSGRSGSPFPHRGEELINEPFGRPQVLTRLGQFIMDVKMNMPVREGGWAGNTLLPLIMFSQKQDTMLVVGISPLVSNLRNQNLTEKQMARLRVISNFRQFFKVAAEANKALYWNHYFDTNIIEIHKDFAHDFLGELNDLMKKASMPFL